MRVAALARLAVGCFASASAPTACHQQSAFPLDSAGTDAGSTSGDAAVEARDASPEAAEPPCDAKLQVMSLQAFVGPYPLMLIGGGPYLKLFMIEASGQGSDVASCTAVARHGTKLEVACHDGPQSKSATVTFAAGELVADIDIDGVRTQSRGPAPACTRIVDDLPPELTRAPLAASHACPDGEARRRVDAFFRAGQRDRVTRMVRMYLDVPALGIHRSVGEIAGGTTCRSEVTRRGWAYVYCNDGDSGMAAKVVATRGDLVIERNDGIEQIATPCEDRVVLHALRCDGSACESFAAPAGSGW
jgi:hypothetical protein